MLAYIQLCVQQGRTSERILVVNDSGVVKGGLRRFRSSSWGLNLVLRQFAGLSLACDLYIEVLLVPMWANPKDAPSRKASLAGWI